MRVVISVCKDRGPFAVSQYCCDQATSYPIRPGETSRDYLTDGDFSLAIRSTTKLHPLRQ